MRLLKREENNKVIYFDDEDNLEIVFEKAERCSPKKRLGLRYNKQNVEHMGETFPCP